VHAGITVSVGVDLAPPAGRPEAAASTVPPMVIGGAVLLVIVIVFVVRAIVDKDK
jgi:hypothetical protein